MLADHARALPQPESWHAANQRWLVAALTALRARLEPESTASGAAAREAAAQISRSMQPAPALLTLASTFELSGFEQDLLLLCAAVELDAGFAKLVADSRGDALTPQPTFGLALASLADPHWSALSPARPLRRFRLVELGQGPTLTTRALHIDERVLHYVAGVDEIDQRLVNVLHGRDPASTISPSQHALVAHAVDVLRPALERREPPPIVHLRGRDIAAKRAIARRVCDELGLDLLTLSQTNALEDPALCTLLERELWLCNAGLLVLADEVEPSVRGARWLDRSTVPVLLSTDNKPWRTERALLAFDVQNPLPSEQNALWQAELGHPPASVIEPLVSHFDLGAEAIRAASFSALSVVKPDAGGDLRSAVWDACRRLSRPRLEGLADRIVPSATWDDLVVTPALRELLEQIVMHVTERNRVHATWAFTRRGTRGLGISALFSGPSGTGKTLAAEVLANALRLDLYRVDISQVVSKYIGETEKNLSQVFDAAEESSSVLLFDEADALFGKRSETIKEGSDRYANLEVSYLLQRMETYRGLAILTTNLKAALDPAFLRRLQFVATFPFPVPDQRAAIWRRLFPTTSACEELDFGELAQMNLTGGNIYNVARNAAFLAAADNTPVQMRHLRSSARSEFTKLERPLNVTRRDG